MLLKKKFGILFGIFSSILIFLIFNFFNVQLKMGEKTKRYKAQKQSLIELYQRRDDIKDLFFIKEYDEFIIQEEKIRNTDLVHASKNLEISDSLKTIDNCEHKILELYKEKLFLDDEFLKEYVIEKEVRYKIRDLVSETSNYDEMVELGKVFYQSKEALFQYVDESHFDEWINSIEKLGEKIKDKDSALLIGSYKKISNRMSEILLKRNKVEEEIDQLFKGYTKTLKEMDSELILLGEELDRYIEEEEKNSNKSIVLIFVFLILFLMGTTYLLNILILKPIVSLREGAQKISEKKFDFKIEIKNKDEIGELANSFNIMSNHLEMLYVDLEKMVKKRTMELEASNEKLLKEVEVNKRLEKILKKQAVTDELTGLLNRRAAYTIMRKEFSKAKREKDVLSVAYLDIDNFKEINDTLGHEAGDEYLVSFSKIIQRNLRVSDYLFRVGGDEFIIMFRGLKKVAAEKIILERMASDLKSKMEIDFSYGVIEVTLDSDNDLDEIIRKTDKKMYEHKKSKK